MSVQLRSKLADQLRLPSGIAGRFVARILAWQNQPANNWTLSLLDIQPDDRVLELGFGPGDAIQKATTLAVTGKVAGVDLSPTMLEVARQRNASAIAAGRLDLRLGDSATLPFPDRSFDKAFAVQVVYFWKEPLRDLRELHRVMKEGGRVALFLTGNSRSWLTRLADIGKYRSCRRKKLVRLVTEAGFRRVRLATAVVGLVRGFCVLAEK